MPDLVENGLEDDDGKGGEKGRGEEVHLERRRQAGEIDQLQDMERSILRSVVCGTDLMKESVGVWDDVVTFGDELRAQETLLGQNWLLSLVQADIASSRSTRDVVTEVSLSND